VPLLKMACQQGRGRCVCLVRVYATAVLRCLQFSCHAAHHFTRKQQSSWFLPSPPPQSPPAPPPPTHLEQLQLLAVSVQLGL
jgi:hypothetical protein